MKRTRVIEMGRTALECIDSLSCTACVLCLNPQLHHVGEGGGEGGGVGRGGGRVLDGRLCAMFEMA